MDAGLKPGDVIRRIGDREVDSAEEFLTVMSGADGGEVIAEGPVAEISKNPGSKIGPFLSGNADTFMLDPSSRRRWAK